ncbi:GNAT family N-acetyltransferase [Oceanimonas baumannii]|uniref:GNAT family N-acetyltransferase n=1 Tax=Oceanimonas baumannii TaxID=129578 RepID=UPI003A93F5EA
MSLVIETDSEVVGYASGYRHVNLASCGQVALLDEIVINPALRGRGLGRILQKITKTGPARY